MSNVARSRSTAKHDLVETAMSALGAGIREIDFVDWIQTMIAQATSLRSAVRFIGPVDAQYILSCHNDRNRPIRPHKVETYARILRAGDHLVTHQGISFSVSGRLNNGQNRLAAIAQTGIGAELYVTFGESDEAFNVIDANTMSKRSPGDTLAVAGYTNYNTVAAIAAMILGRAQDLGGLKKKTFGNNEILRFAEANRLDLEAAATDARVISSKLKCGAASLGYALYLIVERSSYLEKRDARVYRQFLEALVEPAKAPEIVSTIMPLRDGLMKWALDDRFRSGADKKYAQSAAVIKCWNNVATGKKKPILWRVGEAFPVPA